MYGKICQGIFELWWEQTHTHRNNYIIAPAGNNNGELNWIFIFICDRMWGTSLYDNNWFWLIHTYTQAAFWHAQLTHLKPNNTELTKWLAMSKDQPTKAWYCKALLHFMYVRGERKWSSFQHDTYLHQYVQLQLEWYSSIYVENLQ